MTQLKVFTIGERCFYQRTSGRGGHRLMAQGFEVTIVKVLGDNVIVVRTDDARRLTVGESSLWELPLEPE